MSTAEQFSGRPIMSASACLEQWARSAPRREAIASGADRVAFSELLALTQAAAGKLQECGIVAGDVVAHQLPNGVDALVVTLATCWLGAVLCPIVPIYKSREVSFILDEVKPRVFVAIPEHRGRRYGDEARALCEPRGIRVLATDPLRSGRLGGTIEPHTAVPRAVRALDATSLVLFTSGTTAMPKGVAHCTRNLMVDAIALAAMDRLDERDVLYVASTMTHISGALYGSQLPLLLGCKLCLVDQWTGARGASVIERERCTWTGGATPFLRSLVYDEEARARDLHSLRAFRCGGAEVPPTLIEDADRAGIHAYRSYGCTEHPTISGCAGDDLRMRAHTDGRVHRHVEIRVVDPEQPDRPLQPGAAGELWTRGPDRCRGYLREEQQSEAFVDGWFRTGDLGRIDAGGYLHIVGRRKDIIIRKGENLSAKEIEDLVARHPAVSEVAVIGLPDAQRGERVCAIVILTQGSVLSVDDLARFLDGFGIARQKYPEQVESLASFPRTPSGKIKKGELRAMLAGTD